MLQVLMILKNRQDIWREGRYQVTHDLNVTSNKYINIKL